MNIIYFALIVPVITALVLLWKFKHKTVWWEFLVPFAVSVLLVIFSKWMAETSQTTDYEYWGGWVAYSEYYERWDEEVPCTHSISCSHPTRDSKGNVTGYQHINDGYMHLYDVDDHPPRWYVYNSNDESIGVDRRTFERLAGKFGSRKFVDLGRDYHSIDGDKYVATWSGDASSQEPTVTLHSYENRVQASNSVFNFEEVDPKDYGLFDYPKISNYFQLRSVLGDSLGQYQEANHRLNMLNANLGREKQVRMWILLFKNQPLVAGLEQESYWKGGNKNEFILAIGVDEAQQVKWCYPISWTEVEGLKVDARNFVVEQDTLNLNATVDWLGANIKERFIRKPFADFSYLTVEPPLWAVILTFFITIAVNVGLSWWIVVNEHTDEPIRRNLRYSQLV